MSEITKRDTLGGQKPPVIKNCSGSDKTPVFSDALPLPKSSEPTLTEISVLTLARPLIANTLS